MMGRRPFFIFIAPVVFILDRLSKIVIQKNFSEGQGLAVFPGIFHLTRVNNSGAAFGALKDAGNFLIVVSALSVVVITVYLCRELFGGRRAGQGSQDPAFSHYAWAFVAAGAAGNLYDRLRFGYVIDFLDFRVWPVFNIADTSICLGVFFVLLSFLWRRKTEGTR